MVRIKPNKTAEATFNKILLALLLTITHVSWVQAHEYWIEPTSYQIELGQQLKADLKNGVDFGGTSFPYISSNIVSFELTNAGGKTPIKGRDGDSPALRFKPEAEGLHTFSFFNTASSIVFQDYERFKKYFKAEGAEALIERHEQLDLPKEKIREIYSRCAKTLVQVGEASTAESDSFTGMPAELVALQNPYTLKPGENLEVQVIWMEKPYEDIQVRVFEKLGVDENGLEMVKESRPRTNSKGIIEITPNPGAEYLLSSVVLIDNTSPFFMTDSDAHWESYWASLTFKMPN